MTKFKQLRHFTAATVMTAGLCACASAPSVAMRQRVQTPQPLARLTVVTPDADHDLLAQLLAGEMALDETDIKAASGYYARAMTLSEDPKVAERAADLALATHQADVAQRALDRWQALGAKPANLAQARAMLALRHGNEAEAKHQLIVLTSSGDKDAWRQFGRVLLDARDQAQAADLLVALAIPARLPNDDQAWLAMSEMGLKFGRKDYAMHLAEAAVSRFHNPETYAWAAQMRYNDGDHAGAEKLLRQALARNPGNVRLRLTDAGMLIQSGNYADAARLLDHGPQTAETYAMRVALAAHAKDRKALASLYRQMQQASPEVINQSAYLLGQLAEMQHQPDQALDWYGRVGDGDPHAFDADLRSAVIMQAQGRSSDAHELLEQMQLDYLQQPKALRQAYGVDADLYMAKKEYARAEMVFSRALQVMPNDTDMLYGRGLAYAQAGQTDKAVDDFRRVLKIKPGDVEAGNALGFTLADADRDLPEATRLIAQARQAKPDDPSIADSWGWLQYRLGHLDQAATVLRGAWQASKDPDVGVHLGEVLWKQGHRSQAQQVFDQVRRLDPDNLSLKTTLKRLQS
jgi:tetratricopeptide (TPR) repeat protein